MLLLSSPNRLPLSSLFCFVSMFSIDVFPEMFVPSFLSLFSIYWITLPLVFPVPHYTSPSSGLCGSHQPYRGRQAGCWKQRLIPTRVSDPLNRKLKTCILILLPKSYSYSYCNELMPPTNQKQSGHYILIGFHSICRNHILYIKTQ